MRNKRSEIERRLRVMAKAKVAMVLGLYEWPDGRSPILPNGAPRVSNRELLRLADYSPRYKSPEKTLFSDPYFITAYKTEMARRESKSNALVAYDPNRVCHIRDLIWEELETRLTTEPESFTRSELLQFGVKYEELTRVYAPGATDPKTPDKMQQFNAFISRTVTVMNETEKQDFVATAAGAAEDRIAQLNKLIDESNAVEEDADDLDVIDATVCAE